MRAAHESEFREYTAATLRTTHYFVYLSCGDWQRAEDLTQSAYEKLYLAWPRIDAAKADAYLRRTIVNMLINQSKRAWFRRERSHAEPPERGRSGEPATEDRMVLLDALSRLPSRQRATLVLRFWEDRSVQQTAAAMNCSESTVKSQTAHAVKAMRRLLDLSPDTAMEAMT